MDNQLMTSMLDALKQIVLAAIPSIFAIYIFKLSSSKEKLSRIDQILNERMKNLYIPLYQRYMRGILSLTMIGIDIHDSSEIEKWNELFNFLIDNIHFMGEESQKHMHSFSHQMLELMVAVSKSSFSLDAEVILEFNGIYQSLMSKLFKEYIDICNKLGLPKPAINDF